MSTGALTKSLTGSEGRIVRVFLYLQILDLLTTVVGLNQGLKEASPFVSLLMKWGPVAGLAGSKLVAVGLAGLAVLFAKVRLLLWINYWYAALVVWNLFVIVLGQSGY
jgi:hypothetical protein